MRLVYLAHPYGGDEKNVKDAEKMVKQLIKEHKDTVFLSPLQATGFYYKDIPYMEGMHHCIELLSRCDEVWLCDGWQDSRGCCMEYMAATMDKSKAVCSLDKNGNLVDVMQFPKGQTVYKF
jgi:hypothetical protein